MNDYFKIVNDEKDICHVYNKDALVLSKICNYGKMNIQNNNLCLNFSIRLLRKIRAILKRNSINFVEEYIENEKNRNIFKVILNINTDLNKEIIDNMEGSFTIKYGNEDSMKISIDSLNREAAILKEILIHDINEKFYLHDEEVTIIEKEIHWVRNPNKIYESKNKFIEKLKKYGGQGFIHATSFDNLYSILNEKFLYSRNNCSKKNIAFKDNANQYVLDLTKDDIKNNVRFYFRPKTPALYNFYNSDKKICLIIFDYKLLLDAKSGMIADRIVTNDNCNIFDINSEKDMNSLIYSFSYENVFNTEYVENKCDEKDCKSAELLIPETVSTKYIKEIIFPNHYLCDEFKRKFWYVDFNVSVNPDMFYNNCCEGFYD